MDEKITTTEAPRAGPDGPQARRGWRWAAGVLWLAVGAAAVAGTVLISAWIGRPKEVSLTPPSIAETGAGKDLDIEQIRGLVQSLALLESRVTGYGDSQAADILLAELNRAGVRDVQVQEFQVPSPIVESATLRGPAPGGTVTVPLHPLWPNLARTSQTPPEGLTGPLVYVGKGTDAELARKKIAESLLALDWDCQTEWLSAPEFGAKAVLFRAGQGGSGYSARDKFLTVPANIPRYYVAAKDLPELDKLCPPASRPTIATVHCKSAWRTVTARNILARVCGPAVTDPNDPDQAPILFHAYYDSISVVPSLSPGAEQACGAAVLVELARFFARVAQTPPRGVYILLTGGHGQALSGMIHFISQLRRGLDRGWQGDEAKSLLARMGRPGLFVGLDLSSRCDRLGMFCLGRFRPHHEGQLREKLKVLGQKLDAFAKSSSPLAVQEKQPPSFVDCINPPMGRGWWTYFPYPPAFESEVAVMAGFPGVTLATINDDRAQVDTPDDNVQRLRVDMLGRQVTAEPGRRVGLVNLALALVSWRGPFVSAPLEDRWAYIDGRVVWLDQQRDYTPNEPLAGAVVFVKTDQGDKYLMGTRGIGVARTDPDGRFRFDGLSRPLSSWDVRKYLVEAYGLATREFIDANPRARGEYLKVLQRAGKESGTIRPDGSIIFAVDMARPKEYPWEVQILKEDQSINLVCFPCKSISLYGLTDPREYIELSDLQILDAATQSPPFQFGQSATAAAYGRAQKNCLTLWADPTIRVRLTFGFGFQKRRLILINNDLRNPVGEGYVLEDLETIPSMVLQGAADMWNLDQSRIDKLQSNGISNPRIRKIHQEAREYLSRAREALKRHDYLTYRSASEKGWACESKAYGELLSITNNMVRGVLFYLAVLIPFAYCLERLLVAAPTIRRRLIGMMVIFGISFAVLALVHPAFRFTLTPMIVLLAFVILTLGAVVMLLVVGKFDRMLQERKHALTGLHEDTRNVGQIAVHAVDLGIANIRRRPRRGSLTAATIVLVTFTLLSFTSLVPELSISKLRHPDGDPSAYRGLMIRNRNWGPLPAPLYESIQRSYGEAAGGAELAGIQGMQGMGKGGQEETAEVKNGHGTGDTEPEAGKAGIRNPQFAPGAPGRNRVESQISDLKSPGSPASRPAGSVVAGRAWFFSDTSGQLSQIDLSVSYLSGREAGGAGPEPRTAPASAPASRPASPGATQPATDGQATGHFTAVALLCMEHTEPAVTGIDRALLPGSRWFRDAGDVGIILPVHAAKFLGLTARDIGKGVLLFGEELPLIGLYDSRKLDELRDIDGEPLTPVNFVQQEQNQAQRPTDEEVADTIEKYVHWSSDQVAIIPLKYGLRLSATYRSIAVKTPPRADPDVEAESFARRSNSTILAGDGSTVTLYAAMDSERFSVAGTILVPVILGFVMVLGTMLGSVYERKREIFVYNCVGLSPVNVSSLFLAESSVYAILGAAVGFLLGQVIAKVLLTTGALSGLNLNYSAGTAVFVTVLTMVIVLLSTLYPARQAFLAAVPESHRTADFGEAQASADRISIFLPFVATPGSVLGMQAYMYEFLDSVQGVTVGRLAVDDLLARLEVRDARNVPVLAFRAWLAPFDQGVSHDAELRILYRADRGVWQYHLTGVRFSGDQQNWRRLTPRFLVIIRKQLLMWRILTGEAIEDYVRRGEAMFGCKEDRSPNA